MLKSCRLIPILGLISLILFGCGVTDDPESVGPPGFPAQGEVYTFYIHSQALQNGQAPHMRAWERINLRIDHIDDTSMQMSVTINGVGASSFPYSEAFPMRGRILGDSIRHVVVDSSDFQFLFASAEVMARKPVAGIVYWGEKQDSLIHVRQFDQGWNSDDDIYYGAHAGMLVTEHIAFNPADSGGYVSDLESVNGLPAHANDSLYRRLY